MKPSSYRDKVWGNYVSPYIRLRDTNGGYGKCITCGKVISYKAGHAGHWRHGKLKATYFFEKNIHLQCSSCNTYKHGMRDVYAVKLEEKYGYGILQYINHLDDPKFIWTISKLKDVETEYKMKLKNLKYERSHPSYNF